jgi:fatty acid desaturase
MQSDANQRKITWYRSRLDREVLRSLNQRSDWKGMLQTLGHLGLLALTGTGAFYAAGRLPLPVLLLILFLHGTVHAFLLNGFHELCHNSVFRTKFLNTFFLRIFSFLGPFNYVRFWASHSDHHKYTLHPPDDYEVMLPVKLTFSGFLKSAIVNPWGFYARWKLIVRLSFGKLEGPEETVMFPKSDMEKRRELFNWARIQLVGHALIVGVSLYFGLWLVPVLITLAPAYGGWLLYLCNTTQHVGLTDNVPDFRLCCRTITLNPLVRFLYWHMNFHIEHHMYAAVPCYNLGKLHKLIKHELPHCPVGLFETWKQIITILKKQKTDPEYQYVPELPMPLDA